MKAKNNTAKKTLDQAMAEHARAVQDKLPKTTLDQAMAEGNEFSAMAEGEHDSRYDEELRRGIERLSRETKELMRLPLSASTMKDKLTYEEATSEQRDEASLLGGQIQGIASHLFMNNIVASMSIIGDIPVKRISSSYAQSYLDNAYAVTYALRWIYKRENTGDYRFSFSESTAFAQAVSAGMTYVGTNNHSVRIKYDADSILGTILERAIPLLQKEMWSTSEVENLHTICKIVWECYKPELDDPDTTIGSVEKIICLLIAMKRNLSPSDLEAQFLQLRKDGFQAREILRRLVGNDAELQESLRTAYAEADKR